jgi:hypothetical protein
MENVSADHPIVLRTSAVKAAAPAGLICGLTVLIVWFFSRPGEGWLVLVMLLISLIILGLVYWANHAVRLEISPLLVAYYAPGYRILAPWEEISGWSTRTVGTRPMEVLVLRHPAMELSWWMQTAAKLLRVLEPILLANGRSYQPDKVNSFDDMIPISIFDPIWNMDETGALIKKYAPQALTALDEPQEK